MTLLQQIEYKFLGLWLNDLEDRHFTIGSRFIDTGEWFLEMSNLQYRMVSLYMEIVSDLEK